MRASKTATQASDKASVQRWYDRMAGIERDGAGLFESLTPTKRYFRSRKLQTALLLGGFPAQGRLLEIGCSVGQFTDPLVRMGYHMCGVDVSPNSIEVAKRRAQAAHLTNVSFMVGDAERLSQFPDQTFDGVVSFSTLRYVADLRLALAEIHRVLKPDARAVIDFPNRWCPWFYLKPWLGSERHPHDHWFSRRAVERLCIEGGFQDVLVRHLLFTPTVAPARLLTGFQVMDWVGERLPIIRRLAGILMVGATKP